MKKITITIEAEIAPQDTDMVDKGIIAMAVWERFNGTAVHVGSVTVTENDSLPHRGIQIGNNNIQTNVF